MGGGRVIEIKSQAEWDAELAKNKSGTIVVDFTATWCGPCNMMAPEFAKFSTEFASLVFLKVDVDELSSVAAACGVSAMPTFQVWQNGTKVDEMIGASKEKLKAMIQKYA